MRIATIFAVALLGTTSLAATEHAQAAIQHYQLNISRQSLDTALKDLAQQTGLQIGRFSARTDGGAMVGPVLGDQTPEQALKTLLHNTGLEYKIVSDTTIAVYNPKDAASARFDSSLRGSEEGAAGSGRSTSQNASGSPDDANTSKEAGKKTSQDFRVAQVDQGKNSISTSVGEQASASQKNSRGPSVGLEEIVVTAQKRSENIQDVPISMSAVTADKLVAFNATRLSDIAELIPGLQIDSQTGQPGSANITLRGVSTGGLSSTTTATTIDDVPMGSSSSYGFAPLAGTDLLPYDLDHVEVLRGPQGTLYGASSLGGLLKYVTPTPNLEETAFRVGGDLSGTDHSGSQVGGSERAVLNIPLVPGQLAINASAGHVNTPGYIDNLATDRRAYNDGTQDAARLSVLWKPNDDFSAKVFVLFNRSDFNGFGAVPFNFSTGQALYGYSNTKVEEPSGDIRQQLLYAADLVYKMGWADLTSVTGYSDARANTYYDIDQYTFYGNNHFQTHKSSEELRLSSPEGQQRLRWMVGAFYTHEITDYHELDYIDGTADAETPTPSSATYNDNQSSSYIERAGFANVTYKLTDVWDTGGGVRYSENYQTAHNVTAGTLDGPSSPPQPTSDSSTTYSFDSRYHFLPGSMVYGRIATAYRPGGANLEIAPIVPPKFEPDHLISYELGIKSEWLDKRVLLDLTGYYINWTDIQITERAPSEAVFTGNAGRAKIKGIEFDSAYTFTNNLRFGLNGAYTDAKLAVDAPALGASAGDRLPYTPRLTGAVTADWTHGLGADYEANLHAAWRYVGERESNFPLSQSGDAHLGSYEVVDLAAGLSWAHWRVNAFLRNAANKQAYLSAIQLAAILPPRTFGLGGEYSF